MHHAAATYRVPDGVRVQIEHLDGHKVKLSAGGVTRPGQVVLIKGEGMPVYDSVRIAQTIM